MTFVSVILLDISRTEKLVEKRWKKSIERPARTESSDSTFMPNYLTLCQVSLPIRLKPVMRSLATSLTARQELSSRRFVRRKLTILISDIHSIWLIYIINCRMSCCFQIERVTLPRQFLFDSLRLYAKFQSTAVDLLTLMFDLTQASAERIIPLNVQLKIPSARSKFTLVLQVKIINMRISTSEVFIDLSAS